MREFEYDGCVLHKLDPESGCGLLPYKNIPHNPPYHQYHELPMSWDNFYAFMDAWFLLDYRWKMDDEESAQDTINLFNSTVRAGIVYG